MTNFWEFETETSWNGSFGTAGDPSVLAQVSEGLQNPAALRIPDS